jgi:hypothetical protein
VRAYADALIKAGARQDGFTAAAFGDRARVAKLLARDPAWASARDAGGLTALQCACGSRLTNFGPDGGIRTAPAAWGQSHRRTSPRSVAAGPGTRRNRPRTRCPAR